MDKGLPPKLPPTYRIPVVEMTFNLLDEFVIDANVFHFSCDSSDRSACDQSADGAA